MCLILLLDQFFALAHPEIHLVEAFWDAVTVGCINVIYENNVKYPFDDIINYEDLAVYIPEQLANYTIDILKSIPENKIKEKQNYIEKHREKFQYTIVPNTTTELYTNDAFDMILAEVYKYLNISERL
eukprot:Phypoly_transcript_23573.p1 GENE.Phypoly_transcript_23573~~Phypoly_transcript_23573.p1  ORF type:complete len:128 (+),score=14.12 Phypoly_transcript_23573:188-571(+)